MRLQISKSLCFLFALLSVSLATAPISADIIDSGTFSGSDPNTGSYVAGTSMFNLTLADIPAVELLADFSFIDDGAEIVVNGTSLFIAAELSQFGPQDFVTTGDQPNDIENPWNSNSNTLPRLTVASNGAVTDFSGAVTESATSTVVYQPAFAVSDFSSLLVVGSNTIEFVNHNGFEGATIAGDYSVSTNVTAVPEPSSIGMLLLSSVLLLRRRRRQLPG